MQNFRFCIYHHILGTWFSPKCKIYTLKHLNCTLKNHTPKFLLNYISLKTAPQSSIPTWSSRERSSSADLERRISPICRTTLWRSTKSISGILRTSSPCQMVCCRLRCVILCPRSSRHICSVWHSGAVAVNLSPNEYKPP